MKGEAMFLKNIHEKLNALAGYQVVIERWMVEMSKQQKEILEQQKAMVLAQRAANDAFSGIIAETGGKSPFKLDDAKMQEGISNLMGYDPFSKKRGDE